MVEVGVRGSWTLSFFCAIQVAFHPLFTGSAALCPVSRRGICNPISERFATYGMMMVFSLQFMSSLVVNIFAEEILELGSILVDQSGLLVDAAIYHWSVNQNVVFDKQLLTSWSPSGSTSSMLDLGKLWFSPEGLSKSPLLRNILYCLICLVNRIC